MKFVRLFSDDYLFTISSHIFLIFFVPFDPPPDDQPPPPPPPNLPKVAEQSATHANKHTKTCKKFGFWSNLFLISKNVPFFHNFQFLIFFVFFEFFEFFFSFLSRFYIFFAQFTVSHKYPRTFIVSFSNPKLVFLVENENETECLSCVGSGFYIAEKILPQAQALADTWISRRRCVFFFVFLSAAWDLRSDFESRELLYIATQTKVKTQFELCRWFCYSTCGEKKNVLMTVL